MERTRNLTPEEGALIAPGEIRELVARLTEQSVEALPVGEARTLEGLALETGIPVVRLRETLERMRREGRFRVPPLAWAAFVALGGLGVWAVRHTPGVEIAPPVVAPVAQPAVVEPDLSGTVPLTQVTYGPDGGDLRVDPSFEPTRPLPKGVSISATVGKVLWGNGDHRARAIDEPLSPDEERAVQNVVEELLRYVRKDASRRHIPWPQGGLFISCNTYSGSGVTSASLPPSGTENDPTAEAAGRRAAKGLVASLQGQLRWHSEIRRQVGP